MPSKSEEKRITSQRRTPELVQFCGPVVDIRYVQLVDGRKIMQVFRNVSQGWITPATVPVQTLSDRERDEMTDVLAAIRDQNAR